MASIYDLAENYPDAGNPNTSAAQTPVVAPMTAQAPVSGMATGNPELMSMLGRYFPAGNEYETEIKSARETNAREQEAFQKMLQTAMAPTQDVGPSKAEMYFRLAAAFGSPTKTGNFMESLGTAGNAASDMLKERRTAVSEAKSKNLQLGLEAQKLRMTGAKDDLTTLRQLASEGMKDKRTIASELIKDYVKSGQPQSSAGKQAQDEGLKPGSPEFQARVSKIAENNVEKQMAQINATLANISVSQANTALAQQKFGFQQEQAAKLTPAEVKLKTETEDTLSGLDASITALKKAYALNPNTFDASLVDTAQRKVLEAAGSKDPKVQNTREMETLLSSGAVDKLRAAFGGNPTEGERSILLSLEGLSSKSKEERAKIMKNNFQKLQEARTARRKRLNEISSGLYRNTGEADTGGLE